MEDRDVDDRPFFYGLDVRPWNRLCYKLFLTPTGICGANIGNQFAWGGRGARGTIATYCAIPGLAYPLATGHGVLAMALLGGLLALLGWLLSWPVLQLAARRRLALERRYDALDPQGPAFLQLSRYNFRLDPRALARVTVGPRTGRGVRGLPVAGMVEFHLGDRSVRRFAVLGEDDLRRVRDRIAAIAPHAEFVP